MAAQENTYVRKAKQFLKSLNEAGIDVAEAYLFGSAVNGLADNESDIDVAVVSRDFQGIPYYDMEKISKHRRAVDLRLEIHPFSWEEVETDPPQFFLKIKKEGLRIHMN